MKERLKSLAVMILLFLCAIELFIIIVFVCLTHKSKQYQGYMEKENIKSYINEIDSDVDSIKEYLEELEEED